MPFDSYSALLEGIDEIVTAGKDLGTQTRGLLRISEQSGRFLTAAETGGRHVPK